MYKFYQKYTNRYIKYELFKQPNCSIFNTINNTYKNLEMINSYDNNYIPYKDINYDQSSNKCCLVEKKINNADSCNQSAFIYNYTELHNEQCNLDLYRLDSNKQLLFDNINNWSNTNCNNNNQTLGSCRNINKECLDFVDKDFCDKYKMVWSTKTCNDIVQLNNN